MCVIEYFKSSSSHLWKWCDPDYKCCNKSNLSSKVYSAFLLPLPHLSSQWLKESKFTFQYFVISRRWKGIRFTSSKICFFSPQMNKVPAPWSAAKIIIEVPSQIWYLTLASKWIPRSLVIVIPLNIGRSRSAKQASASKPLRVAILKSLNCHLQDSSKHHSHCMFLAFNISTSHIEANWHYL